MVKIITPLKSLEKDSASHPRQRRAENLDLRAVNPNAEKHEDTLRLKNSSIISKSM
jgi:hypothetical protein